MAHRFIADLQPGEQIEDQTFLIRSKDLRTTNQGSLYVHVVLTDKTGQLPARIWQATEAMFNALPEGGFINLKGRTESYKGSLQFIIGAIRTVDLATVDLGDFLPKTDRDIDEMESRLREILAGVEHPDLAALVREFLDDQELMTLFSRSAAAVIMHHACVGGLLEHTLNILEVVLKVIPLYPKLSLDLMLAGAFLHDFGKALELQSQTNIAYTDEGQLIGHIVQATMLIEKKAQAVAEKTGKPFPDGIRIVLEHMVLSHHGCYEFGSPKLPAIPEAIALHHLDNLDAKVNMFLTLIESDPDADGHWTNYQRSLETKLYKVDPMGLRGS